jgi:hypothetical protein
MSARSPTPRARPSRLWSAPGTSWQTCLPHSSSRRRSRSSRGPRGRPPSSLCLSTSQRPCPLRCRRQCRCRRRCPAMRRRLRPLRTTPCLARPCLPRPHRRAWAWAKCRRRRQRQRRCLSTPSRAQALTTTTSQSRGLPRCRGLRRRLRRQRRRRRHSRGSCRCRGQLWAAAAATTPARQACFARRGLAAARGRVEAALRGARASQSLQRRIAGGASFNFLWDNATVELSNCNPGNAECACLLDTSTPSSTC